MTILHHHSHVFSPDTCVFVCMYIPFPLNVSHAQCSSVNIRAHLTRLNTCLLSWPKGFCQKPVIYSGVCVGVESINYHHRHGRHCSSTKVVQGCSHNGKMVKYLSADLSSCAVIWNRAILFCEINSEIHIHVCQSISDTFGLLDGCLRGLGDVMRGYMCVEAPIPGYSERRRCGRLSRGHNQHIIPIAWPNEP